MNNSENYDVLEKFLLDPLSEQYFVAIQDVTKTRENMWKKTSGISSRISEIKSLEHFKDFTDKHYNEPEEIYSIIVEFSLLAKRVREKYPELVNLDEQSLNVIFNKLIDSQKTKNYGEKFRIQDQCSEQLDSSLDTCRQGATIGAFICGFEIPTVIGTVICGLSVLGGLEICNDAAWDSSKICIKYN